MITLFDLCCNCIEENDIKINHNLIPYDIGYKMKTEEYQIFLIKIIDIPSYHIMKHNWQSKDEKILKVFFNILDAITYKNSLDTTVKILESIKIQLRIDQKTIKINGLIYCIN